MINYYPMVSITGTIFYTTVSLLLLRYIHDTKDMVRYRNIFFIMGFWGQILLILVSYGIYVTQRIRESIYMYISIYAVFLISFSFLDMSLYVSNKNHFSNRIAEDDVDDVYTFFVDFVYYNISTVSTISYGDLLVKSFECKIYTIYKVMIVIFICTFLLNDIVVKSS